MRQNTERMPSRWQLLSTIEHHAFCSHVHAYSASNVPSRCYVEAKRTLIDPPAFLTVALAKSLHSAAPSKTCRLWSSPAAPPLPVADASSPAPDSRLSPTAVRPPSVRHSAPHTSPPPLPAPSPSQSCEVSPSPTESLAFGSVLRAAALASPAPPCLSLPFPMRATVQLSHRWASPQRPPPAEHTAASAPDPPRPPSATRIARDTARVTEISTCADKTARSRPLAVMLVQNSV